MLFILLIQASAFTEEEIEKARICSKLTINLFKSNFDVVQQVLDLKPDLNSSKLQNKIFSDVIDYCREHASMEDLQPIMFQLGNHTWKEFKEHLQIFPERYNDENDLKQSPEHLALRNKIVDTEGGMKYVGDPKDKEATLRQVREKWKQEGKNPEELLKMRKDQLNSRIENIRQQQRRQKADL